MIKSTIGTNMKISKMLVCGSIGYSRLFFFTKPDFTSLRIGVAWISNVSFAPNTISKPRGAGKRKFSVKMSEASDFLITYFPPPDLVAYSSVAL